MERKNANKSIAIITKKYNIKNRKGETVAYTIISQNNTTTTLSDENGNVITVPARVTLATSTDYTITKVNNNSVDLVDGNGKVIRGVPACVVLAGEGGGGGGSVDYAKTVQRAETMPTANASNAGQQFLYSGETDATYTHGYIYENVKTATYTGTVSFESATLSGTTVTCSGDNFAAFLTEAGADPTPIVSGTMTYEADATGWRLVGKDSNNNTVTTFLEYVEDYQDAGFVFTGTPQDGDVIAFTCTVEEASATYTWTRIDVQPSPVIPDPLPSQTGQSGKFLTTDGTDASWSDKPLVNNATGAGRLAVGAGATAGQNLATSYGASAAANSNSSTAIGNTASAQGNYSVAFGAKAHTNATGAVQINTSGLDKTNSDANTFKVGNANGNFEIMSADGTIPEARLADTTSAQQGDVLTLDGNGNAVWQAGGGGGSAPIAQATTVATAPLANAESLAIGNGASAGDSGGSNTKCLAVGINSNCGGTSVTSATTVGYGSQATQYATAVGTSSGSGSAPRSVSVGANMQAGEGGILIGSATSATTGEDDEFDVCLSDWLGTKHLYRLMNSAGKLFADRLGAGYDASKTQTLKNVNGTLTWVDD